MDWLLEKRHQEYGIDYAIICRCQKCWEINQGVEYILRNWSVPSITVTSKKLKKSCKY